MTSTAKIVLLLATSFIGCSSTLGARPEDNSAVGHEQLARQHEAEVASIVATCKQGTPPPGLVCWTTAVSPSPEALRRMVMHATMAADHRRASTALRDTEQRACAGIAEIDRDQSPFLEHRGDIEGVDPLYVPLPPKSGGSRAVGASIRLRAVPGMTAEWLGRLVECHRARNAAMGYAMPEMEGCPLMLKGIALTVSSTGYGFAVEIRSDDVETALAILRRAQALLANR